MATPSISSEADFQTRLAYACERVALHKQDPGKAQELMLKVLRQMCNGEEPAYWDYMRVYAVLSESGLIENESVSETVKLGVLNL